MKTVKKTKEVSRSLFTVKGYLSFFFLISFIVTCCFLLFLKAMDVQFEDVKKSAVITFINVMFLSLLCTVIDGIRRRITIERPVRRILNATQRLTGGDFTARIKPFHRLESMNEFDVIIEDFNKMAEELSGIETLRSDFIASVSHEIKTPLTVIQNCATMLQSPELTVEKRIEYAKSVTATARKLSELITNILRLNKLENQQIFPECEAYDLGEQIRECLLSFEEAWEKKEIEIITEIDETIIKADEELLSIVWNNLFSNAVKFTPQKGRIKVELNESMNKIAVKVSDTGCGISGEAGGRIFDKFYQEDSSRGTGGNGLGLALVKRIIDITGGTITVESAVGEGSIFTVELQKDIS